MASRNAQTVWVSAGGLRNPKQIMLQHSCCYLQYEVPVEVGAADDDFEVPPSVDLAGTSTL